METLRNVIYLLDLLDTVCADQQSLEDGEPFPARKAIYDAKVVIAEGAALTGQNIMSGDVATYYGEVSVTWRRGKKILRLTAFSTPGRPPRLDFGAMLHALGEYHFDERATGAKLADKLTWLYADEAA